MNRIFKRASALLTAVLTALSAAALPSLADDAIEAEEASFRTAVYYNADGKLTGVKRLNGKLSEDETEVLVELYAADGAANAKVFAWTADNEPVEDEARSYGLNDGGSSVVILHTNDMHGSLVGSGSVIGSDRVAALKELENAILADAGDASQGVALASQSKGESVIEIMNAAGYDVMALGNHEFDYGTEQLKALLNLASFPILSANTYLDGGLICGENGDNVIIEKNGVKVGFFALTTAGTQTSTKPENLTGVTFKDEIETAKAQVAELESKGADVTIAVTHMGVLEEEGSYTSEALAREMKGSGLDAIIDGHSHSVVNEVIEGVAIAQTGTGSANVGRMEITVGDDGSVSIDETMLSRAFFDNIAPAPEVSAVIDGINDKLNEKLGQPIGANAATLWGGTLNGIPVARAGETNLGDLICDAMIAEAKDILPKDKQNLPIVAIENGGGFRTTIYNGEMTIGGFINCLPYANAVMTKEITPAALYTGLESFVSSIEKQNAETGFIEPKNANYSGSFPQIGGMSFVYDPNAETGAKINAVYLDGSDTALDRDDAETKLVLVSNDYVMGSDGMFKDCPDIAEGGGLTEAVLAYVNELTNNGAKPLELPISDRRIITAADKPERTYSAHIAVTGENVPDTLTAIVDGNEKIAGKVADGVLEMELADGPHAVKLYEGQQEVYVNNYSGNGVINEYMGFSLGWPELEYNAAN